MTVQPCWLGHRGKGHLLRGAQTKLPNLVEGLFRAFYSSRLTRYIATRLTRYTGRQSTRAALFCILEHSEKNIFSAQQFIKDIYIYIYLTDIFSKI